MLCFFKNSIKFLTEKEQEKLLDFRYIDCVLPNVPAGGKK